MSVLSTLQLEQADGLATLTLTGKMGTLSPAFWSELSIALSQLADERVLIVRGHQNFSAGIDLPSTLERLVSLAGDPKLVTEFIESMQQAIEALAKLPIPVIAAIHGWCIGAGVELACAADLRLCTKTAQFSLPEAQLGMVADLGGLQRLPELIGAGRTTHLALTAEAIDASKAQDWGLVTEVLSTSDDLFERVMKLAVSMAQMPAQSLEGTKQALYQAADHQEGLKFCLDWNVNHMKVEDIQSALLKRGLKD